MYFIVCEFQGGNNDNYAKNKLTFINKNLVLELLNTMKLLKLMYMYNWKQQQ